MNKVSLFAIRHKETRELLYLDVVVNYWHNGEFIDYDKAYYLCHKVYCDDPDNSQIWVTEKREVAEEICSSSYLGSGGNPEKPHHKYLGQLEVVLLTEI